MIFRTTAGDNLTFVSDLNEDGYGPNGKMEHLVCFFPGVLALGSKELDRKDDLNLAKELMETCYNFYEKMPSGLSPESVRFKGLNPQKNFPGNDLVEPEDTDPKNLDYVIESRVYLLRPETVESLMVLYRITKDEKYREMGWNIFQSIEKFTKTPTAYSSIDDVTSESPGLNYMNSMER
ncbi:Endoplasmic reticulum mannosyl-oligosaccharide 1,2-alpha-mannosidase [Smittium mucronatum]|uniref:mannosyl-oligosaccharide 1,2-alpha-mannosidase n=1 Tax=Smittium mucronatum TaxID=133383 RepID=A0A1R0H4B5_9FUNG|nr:Endoplasmic reticulum mannosyl-oligosaccharide 1,2-alpha-mannosidase [Smittium mucronatum]